MDDRVNQHQAGRGKSNSAPTTCPPPPPHLSFPLILAHTLLLFLIWPVRLVWQTCPPPPHTPSYCIRGAQQHQSWCSSTATNYFVLSQSITLPFIFLQSFGISFSRCYKHCRVWRAHTTTRGNVGSRRVSEKSQDCISNPNDKIYVIAPCDVMAAWSRAQILRWSGRKLSCLPVERWQSKQANATGSLAVGDVEKCNQCEVAL